MKNEAKKQSVTITVSGEVQGVGYRYLVRDAANRLGVSGYVKNLPGGEVVAVAEGTAEQLEKFLQEIKIDRAPIHVREVKTRFGRPKGLKGFKIRLGGIPEELSEGFGTGMKYIALTRDEVRAVGEGVSAVGEEVKGVGKEVRSVREEVIAVGEGVKSVREEVKAVGDEVRTVGQELKTELRAVREEIREGFTAMDQKYGAISETLKELTAEFKKLTQLLLEYLKR